MARTLMVGLLQIESKLGEVEANVRHGIEMIEQAASQGAQIACLPELFSTGYNIDLLGPRFVDLAEPLDGPSVRALREAAAANHIGVVAGLALTGDVPGVVYNAAIFVDAEGELREVFAKTHAFGLERMYFRSGSAYRVLRAAGASIGLLICYDAGFPEPARLLMLQGAEVIFVPSAWRIQDKDLWDVNLAARAVDNLLYVVGVNRVGQEGDLRLFGNSRVVHPRGRDLCAAVLDHEQVLVCQLDLDEVVRVRREVRYLMDRRPELYGPLAQAGISTSLP